MPGDQGDYLDTAVEKKNRNSVYTISNVPLRVENRAICESLGYFKHQPTVL